MCLLDTIDGALMFSLYVQPSANFLPPKPSNTSDAASVTSDGDELPQSHSNHRNPVAFLYYSIVLTTLTVIVAIVIGVIQLLTLILNVTDATDNFWDGVQVAGDYYDAIGGGICGCFIIFGGLSVVLHKPWRRWMDRRHGKHTVYDEGRYRDEDSGNYGAIVTGTADNVPDERTEAVDKGTLAQVDVRETDKPRL